MSSGTGHVAAHARVRGAGNRTAGRHRLPHPKGTSTALTPSGLYMPNWIPCSRASHLSNGRYWAVVIAAFQNSKADVHSAPTDVEPLTSAASCSLAHLTALGVTRFNNGMKLAAAAMVVRYSVDPRLALFLTYATHIFPGPC